MDAAPLTTVSLDPECHVAESGLIRKAHAYARAAYAVTEDHGVATRKHHAAAQKFGEAAKDVNDSEAVRILRLLEEHHEKLSRIVRAPVEQAKKDRPKNAPPKPISKSTGQETQASESPSIAFEPPVMSSKSSRRSSPVTQRSLQRESSSSIAHDLATARGIPTPQQRPARQATSRNSKDTHNAMTIQEENVTSTHGIERKADGQVQGIAPQGGTRGKAAPAQASSSVVPETVASEAAFQRFYSTIEGIWSKIPSPLAFTGLPLTQDEGAQPQSQKAEPTTAKTTMTSNAADMKKYFSAAALRAVRDGTEPAPGVHDSFYVVPPGGGTVSYAGMLARERKHARSHSALSEYSDESEEKFVDAHETPHARASLSRIARRASSYRSPSSNKTFEELEEENSQLKQLTDELAHRIYEWEKNSQKQYAAMQQSMRLMPQPSRDSPSDYKSSPSSRQIQGLEERVRVLELDKGKLNQEVARLAKENEKLTDVVARYRERWESLKQSARGRRDSGGPSVSKAAVGPM